MVAKDTNAITKSNGVKVMTSDVLVDMKAISVQQQ
jgi:hypothetical protein